MFDHVKFGVSDYAASKAFFLKALEPLGLAVVSEGPPTYGVELSPKGKASLCLYHTFFFSSRRRHTRCGRDWSSDVCSSDLCAARRWPLPSTISTRARGCW